MKSYFTADIIYSIGIISACKKKKKMKPLHILSVLSILLIFTAGCATSMSKAETEKPVVMKELHAKQKRVSISPLRIFEECVEVQPRQVMEYSFEATDPLHFNVHYHDRSKVFYPVEKTTISTSEGFIDADRVDYYTDEQNYFCLSWKNPHAKSKRVFFNYTVSEK
jgi:hypothetical protein